MAHYQVERFDVNAKVWSEVTVKPAYAQQDGRHAILCAKELRTGGSVTGDGKCNVRVLKVGRRQTKVIWPPPKKGSR